MKSRLWETKSHESPGGNLGHLWRICASLLYTVKTSTVRGRCLTQHLASDKSISDRRRTSFLWGQRLTHFPLPCNKHKGQSQSPLPRNRKQLWEPCPSESGVGKIYLWIFIDYSFKSVLCKDPLKADENWHEKIWLIPESAGPYPRMHVMVVIESWFTKKMFLQMCGLCTAAASHSPARTKQALGLSWALRIKPQIQKSN